MAHGAIQQIAVTPERRVAFHSVVGDTMRPRCYDGNTRQQRDINYSKTYTTHHYHCGCYILDFHIIIIMTSMLYCDADCSPTQMLCNNGLCVAEQLRCDGVDDCGDNTDELTDCGMIREQLICREGRVAVVRIVQPEK